MFESLAGSLRGNVPDQLAQVLGSDARDTRRAMEVSLPALIGGLRDKTREPGGAEDLVDLLEGDGIVAPENIAEFVSSGDARTGAGILDRVFGDRGEVALTSLSKASGLSTRLLARVMSMLAPVATGWLRKEQLDRSMDEAGIKEYLEGEATGLEAQGYDKVLALLGGAGSVAPTLMGTAEAPAAVPPIATTATVGADAGDLGLGGGSAIATDHGIRIGGNELVEVGADELPDFDDEDDDDAFGSRPSGSWMWWVIAAIAFIAFLALLASQCGGDDSTDPTATATTEVNDSVPATDIEQSLEDGVDQVALDDALSIYPGIVARSEGNVAILEGVVADESLRIAAEDAARSVEGVIDVQNLVQVDIGNPIASVIQNNPANLARLDELLKEAGLADALAQTGPFTVFAPVSSAFDNMEAFAALRSDPNQLSELLRYHVVQGSYTTDDLANTDVLATLLEGSSIEITQGADGTPLLNGGVEIAIPNVMADNGILHVITGVLTPPGATTGTPSESSELGAELDLNPITFESSEATLTPEGELELDRVVEFLLANPQAVEVAGHTDSDGPEDFNQTLSEDRAKAVRQYLINNGVPADSITAVGFGEGDPIADNDTPANKAKNRRIEFNLGG